MYKTFAPLRTEFLAFFLILISFSHAQAASTLFTVPNVTVDVTAESALIAREQAFEEAQVKAFGVLAGRMLTDIEMETFIPPDSSVISSMIQDFEVTKEQLSDIRYVGTYIFRFKDKAVKQHFSGQGVRYSDVTSKPILVLPFYQKDGRTVLWSPYNLWMNGWSRAENLTSGLVPLVVPLGDLADASDIDDDEALQYDQAKLNKMVRRYGAGEAVLLIATPDYGLATASSDRDQVSGDLSIYIYRTDRRGPEFVQDIVVRARSGDSAAELFDRAVRDVKRSLQKKWKDQTVVDPGNKRTLRVRVQFENLQQWAQTQGALKKVYGLSSTKIVSLTPQQAELDLTFQGDEQRLRLALKQADFTLTTPRISAGLLSSERYGNGRYNRATIAPLSYDLYLNKYAPPEFLPAYKRRALEEKERKMRQQANISTDSVAEELMPGAGTSEAYERIPQLEELQPEAGAEKPKTYEDIRRAYRQQF